MSHLINHSYAKDKNVFITGNGPSAIVLSYILSGHIPYWNGCPVSNDYLNIKLEQYVKDTSLLRAGNYSLHSINFKNMDESSAVNILRRIKYELSLVIVHSIR